MKLACFPIFTFFSSRQLIYIITLSIVVFLPSTLQAKPPSTVKHSVDRVENNKPRESLILPYFFNTDDLGTVIGLGGMATGLYQK